MLGKKSGIDSIRIKAAELGVELEWREADAEALPFRDGEFDVVTSCIGVMFAPHHQAAADELVRVCSPVVLPPEVVAALDLGPADLADLAALTASLRDRFPVHLREAPPEARRVDSAEDVAVLEALPRVSG